MATERTYIMVKPDGVQRSLVGEIIKRFEQRGFKLVALKMARPTKEHLEIHYQDLRSKGFFPLVDILHGKRTRGVHGVGGHQRGATGSCHSWRNQSCR